MPKQPTFREERPKNSKAPITEDTPLYKYERVFIDEYIICGNHAQACQIARSRCHMLPLKNHIAYVDAGRELLRQPNIQKEVKKIMAELKQQNIMTGKEVMGFFSSVVRGEIKDQFGLDPMLSDRIKAAQEIAKRTIDVDLKANGVEDKSITIKLDWSRKEEIKEAIEGVIEND